MAASMQTEDSEPKDTKENALNSVVVQFFEMVPIRRMKWESGSISKESLDVSTQKEVLNKTVRNGICKKYPPAISYRKAFVKKLLQVLEDFGVEICDDIYEVYTELLQESDGGDESLCYKTYTVDAASGDHVTLQESVNMVSFGTTGLSTWQAAQHLSEWVLQNRELFHSKNVLELGSGLGLTGIITYKQCQVKSYTFTDLHSQVLQLLANNIHRNLSHRTKINCDQPGGRRKEISDSGMEIVDDGLKSPEDVVNNCVPVESLSDLGNETGLSKDCDMDLKSDETCVDENETEESEHWLDVGNRHWERHASFNTYVYKERPGVRLANLDWENLDDELIDHLSDTDIVLAADVVYDNRIIPHLVSTLKQILCSNLQRRDPICAFLASTIRNEDTRDQFLITLSSEGLNYQQVEGPQLWLFHYDKSVPIEILKITANDV